MFQNGKIDFNRDILHGKQLVYMTLTFFKSHMYSWIHEFAIIKYFTSNIDFLLHLKPYKLICIFPVIIRSNAIQMEIQEEILEYQHVVAYLETT